MHRARGAIGWLLPSALLLAGAAPAQVERSGGAVNAQLAQQYQQAVTERSKLQAENTKLKSDLDDARKQLKGAQQALESTRSGANAQRAALSAAQAARDSSARSLDDTKGKMQELITHFKDTAAALKGVEIDRAQLQQDLARTKAAYDQCAVNNDGLYQIGSEVLDRYQHEGAFSRVARDEPFTRIKRTQIDNLALEYRQRAEELRLQKQSSGASSGSSGAAPPKSSP